MTLYSILLFSSYTHSRMKPGAVLAVMAASTGAAVSRLAVSRLATAAGRVSTGLPAARRGASARRTVVVDYNRTGSVSVSMARSGSGRVSAEMHAKVQGDSGCGKHADGHLVQTSTLSAGIPWLGAIRTVTLGVVAALYFGAAAATPAALVPGSPFASLALAIPAVSAEAMATAFRSAWAGLAAGCLHTLAGADHLAALTPLTIGQSHLRASMLGALWGFGHSTGQLMLGLLMVILKDRFQQLVPALSKWGGTTVGLTLLAIGALGVWESFFEHHHDHDHGHDHGHGHASENGGVQKKEKLGKGKGFGLATFATGIVYGLQPDALFVIIPALALPTKLAATAYILMFVLGTVAAMGAYAGVIGATSQVIKSTNSRLTSNLSGAASAMAILIGVGILLSTCGINTPLAIA